MVFGVVGDFGPQYVALVYGALFVVWLVLGLILNLTLRGYSPELLVEIPPYRLPSRRALGFKLWARLEGFVREALPVVLVGIFGISLLTAAGVFQFISDAAAPVVTGLWGLPKEGAVAIVTGFLRKDIAVGMLTPLGLNAAQAVVATTVLAMFFPCIASFAVLTKELGFRGMLGATGIMIGVALVVGTLLNLALTAAMA
jgi:ferrous iron transport protein B